MKRERTGMARGWARLLALVLALCMAVPLPAAGAAVQEDSGSFTGGGTKDNPYLISSNEDLELLSTQVKAGGVPEGTVFRVNADGLSRTAPIGDDAHAFNGTFDGDGNTIALTIDNQSATYQGLFSKIGPSGIIKNLGITGSVSGKDHVGGIAGQNFGTIAGCYNAADITSRAFSMSDAYAGGILGVNSGTIENCYNTGTVSGAGYYVGGIAGQNDKAEVRNCYNAGIISGSSSFTGGIAGRYGTIKDCVSLGARVSGKGAKRIGDTTSTLNNQARQDLKIGSAGTEVKLEAGKGKEDNSNGADLAVDGSVPLSTVFSGWDASVWSISGTLSIGGALPTLKAAQQSPAPTLPEEFLSNIATITKLEFTPTGTMTPALFQPTTYAYSLEVPFGTTEISVKPTTRHPMATVTVNNTPLDSETKSAVLSLNPEGSTTLKALVTAEDGVTTETYTITVTHAVAVLYGVTVAHGTGSGDYAEGESVSINADAPAEGHKFKEWTSTDGVSFASSTSATTTFVMPAKPVTVTATYEKEQYTATVNGGSGSGSYAMGDTVTITANPPAEGQKFKEWMASDGVSFASATSAETTFVMPAKPVTVTAVFEEIPTVAVTGVVLDKTSLTLYTNTDPQSATLVPTVVPPAAANKAVTWTSSAPEVAAVDASSGVVTAVGNGTATITVTTEDGHCTAQCMVTVRTYSGGSSGGSSLRPSVSYSAPSIVKNDSGVQGGPVTAEITVKAKADSKGQVQVTVPAAAVSDAIKAAQEEAKKTVDSASGIAVQVKIDASGKENGAVAVTLPRALQEQAIESGVRFLAVTVDQPGVGLRLDLAALRELNRQVDGDVVLTAVRLSERGELSPEAEAALGERPAFTLTAGDPSGKKLVSDFGDGQVVVELPYVLQTGEQPAQLCAVYVDNDGQASYLVRSVYDTETKSLRFSTEHFSSFGVGYREDVPVFEDLDGHWAAGAVEFAAARGLFTGVEEGKFEPNTTMTRGMLMTVLGRLDGVAAESDSRSSFVDVEPGAYYAGYVEWGVAQGLVRGVGNNRFAPDRAVTRQELAVILEGYVRVTGVTLPNRAPVLDYSDSADISDWADAAVKTVQMAGLMEGRDDGSFDPQGTATRAEVCTMLQRLVELCIAE